MKTYVITLSTKFMSKHPRKGESTNFEEKILSGEKIHTIRGNFDYWKKIIDEVNAGKAILSLRKWNGKPYNSKQTEIKQFTKLGFQEIEVRAASCALGATITRNEKDSIDLNATGLVMLANFDGLSVDDFYYWFEGETTKGIIIHFTDFRY